MKPGSFLSTKQTAIMLGIPTGRLNMAVWSGRLAEPQRGPGGDFLWTDEDVARAAKLWNIRLPVEKPAPAAPVAAAQTA
jgi:hypothetical protein